MKRTRVEDCPIVVAYSRSRDRTPLHATVSEGVIVPDFFTVLT